MIEGNTPEGIVFRRIRPDGEDAWRWHPDGTWAHCADHKGPWICVNGTLVPAEVLRRASEMIAVGALARRPAKAESNG